MKFVVRSIAIFACLAFFTISFAKDAENKARSLINKITNKQVKILRSFAGPGDLVGFVIQAKQGGSPNIIYAQKSGDFAVYGNIFDEDGNEMSQANNEKYAMPFMTKKIVKLLPTVASFTQGKGDAENSMYVVADPNCSACHYFYQAVKPMIDDGSVQITWILVDFLKKTSPGRAAAIMAAKDPAAAMDENEGHFVSKTEEGGIPVMDPITDEMQAKLDANMAFFEGSGFNSTPTIIYCDQTTGKLAFVKGMPRDMAQFMEDTNPGYCPGSKED